MCILLVYIVYLVLYLYLNLYFTCLCLLHCVYSQFAYCTVCTHSLLIALCVLTVCLLHCVYSQFWLLFTLFHQRHKLLYHIFALV